MALLVALAARLAAALAPPRGVVSFELAGVLWDAQMVRSGVRSEMQTWLRDRLRVARLSHFEPLDLLDEFDSMKSQGEEFGFMMPGILTVQKETLGTIATAAGLDGDAKAQAVDEGVAAWLQSHDSYAEMLVDTAAASALSALRDRGFACCAITSGVGDSARVPSLAPLLDWTLNTYEFTTSADVQWDVAFQVALAKYGGSVPWVHVGGAAEGGLAAAAARGIGTIALGEADGDGSSGARIGSLAELPDAVDGVLGSR